MTFSFVLLRMCQLYSCLCASCTLAFIPDRVYFFARGFAHLCMTTVVFWRCNLNPYLFFVFVVCYHLDLHLDSLRLFFFLQGFVLEFTTVFILFFAC